MMFYKEKEEPELREELFENPGAAYRGAPFWAWNKKLNKKELVDQVEQFKKMGMGGFHIHCRVGLDTERDRKSTRLNSSHTQKSRMPSSA